MAYVTAHQHGLEKFLNERGVGKDSIFKERVEIRRGRDYRNWQETFDDFLGKAGDSLPIPWVSSSGTNDVADYVNDVPNG